MDDSDLPQPLDASVADELLTRPPFTRIVNLEETLELTGIAYVDGKPVATFLNKATNERFCISEEPNPQGWKITEATPGAEPHATEVQLMIGGETVTMHYGDAQLAPGGAKKGVPIAHVAGAGPRPEMGGIQNGGERIRTSSYLGEKGRELYAALSREGRDKFKEAIHAYAEKHPGSTMEQTSAVAQKLYAKIKVADEKAGTSASPKPAGTTETSAPALVVIGGAPFSASDSAAAPITISPPTSSSVTA